MVNRNLADALAVSPGGEATLTAIGSAGSALPPSRFRVVGIVDFPFDEAGGLSAAARLADFRRACGTEGKDEAQIVLVVSSERHGPAAAVAAIRRARTPGSLSAQSPG